MATWNSANSMLTSKGVEILNKIKIGEGTATVTRVVAGSGRVEPSKLYQQTTINGSTKEMIIVSKEVVDNGSEIAFYIDNKDFTQPFEVNQLGVYVKYSEFQNEVLYHISQCNEGDPDSIPAFDSTPVTLHYSLFLEHGNSESMSITVNPAGMLPAQRFNEFKENTVSGEFLTVDENGNLIPSYRFTNFSKNVVKDKLLTVDENGNLKPSDVFDNFVQGAEINKLLTIDAQGNLIASGKNTVTGSSFSVSNAIDHRALSLSIEGHSVQSGTPTVEAPVYPVNSSVYGLVSCASKNLFNVEGNMLKKSGVSYGHLTVTPTSLTYVIGTAGSEVPYLGYLMPVEIGKKYTLTYGTISNSILTYIQLDKPIFEITSNEHGTEFSNKTTITASKPYLLVCCHPKTYTAGNTYGFLNVQVEEGSTPTTYTQFVGKDIFFPSPIELNSLGDYEDTIEWDGAKWWKVQRIAEVTMDGVTNKVYSSSGNSSQTYCRYALTETTSKTLITNCVPDAPIITTHGNSTTHPNDTAKFYAFYYSSNKAICGHFLYSAFGISNSQTASERETALNSWLSSQNSAGTPLKLRYVLSTPIVTEIPISDVLEMYSTPTNITIRSNGNTPNAKLGYALNTTDATTMYILRSLARKSEVSTANTFATATITE